MASQRSQPAVPINSRKKNVPSNVLLKKCTYTLHTGIGRGCPSSSRWGQRSGGYMHAHYKAKKARGNPRHEPVTVNHSADRWFSTSQPAHGRPILHPKWPDRGRGTFQYVVCRCVADARNFHAFEAWRAFCFGCSHHRTPSPLPHTLSQFWTRCSIPVNLRVHCA